MSGAILSDCSSAVICRTATKFKEYWRVGSTSTAISPTSASVVVGQHNNTGVINFGATLVYHPVRHDGTFLVAQHVSKPAEYKDVD
jgi:hypothetical protein